MKIVTWSITLQRPFFTKTFIKTMWSGANDSKATTLDKAKRRFKLRNMLGYKFINAKQQLTNDNNSSNNDKPARVEY